MGYTLVEKIIAQQIGRKVKAGEFINPDVTVQKGVWRPGNHFYMMAQIF